MFQPPQGPQSLLNQNRPKAEVCGDHGKPKELICIQCQVKCCDTCALFGNHKSHDVRQAFEVANEIKIRMEVIMEIYQQMDQECEALQDRTKFKEHQELYEKKKQELKDIVSLQFAEWHENLNNYQNQIHADIDMKYTKFDKYFDEQAKVIHESIDKGEQWQFKVCDILDK